MTSAAMVERLRVLIDDATHDPMAALPDVAEAIEREANDLLDHLRHYCGHLEDALREISEIEWREDVDVNGEYVTNQYRDHSKIRADIEIALAAIPTPDGSREG